MKGLLLKDLSTLKQQARIYLLILVLWAFIGITNDSVSFFSGMLIILCTMLPFTALAYDEKVNWNRYALCMPISRDMLVYSKYLLAFLCQLAGAALALLLSLVGSSLTQTLPIVGLTLCIALLMTAVIMPLMLHFGAEKGRTLMMLCFLLPTVAIFLLDKLGITLPDVALLEKLIWLLPVVVIAALVVSILCALRSYRHKEM